MTSYKSSSLLQFPKEILKGGHDSDRSTALTSQLITGVGGKRGGALGEEDSELAGSVLEEADQNGGSPRLKQLGCGGGRRRRSEERRVGKECLL